MASQYIQKSPWFGYGPDKWATLYQSSEITFSGQRSAHNQPLDVLFAAGWVGAALLVSMAVAMLWSSGRARPGVMLALATIATIGAPEATWLVGTYDTMSFSLIALILTGETRQRETAGSAAKVSTSRTWDPARGRTLHPVGLTTLSRRHVPMPRRR